MPTYQPPYPHVRPRATSLSSMILGNLQFCLFLFITQLTVGFATTPSIDKETLTLDPVGVTRLPAATPLPALERNRQRARAGSRTEHAEQNLLRQNVPPVPLVVPEPQLQSDSNNPIPPTPDFLSVNSPPLDQIVYSPLPYSQTPEQSPFLHPLSILLLLLSLFGILATFSPSQLPFALMPSEPRASSSSSKDPRAASSSSSSKDPRAASSSSSRGGSSSSSSKEGSSSSSSSAPKPPQPTPYISPNAWMSFFLFCCLVLIILQGPLGLTGGTGVLPCLPGFGGMGMGGMGTGGMGMGGWPGCNGFVAGAAPWCQPVVQAPAAIVVEGGGQQPIQQPQMGGQGAIAMPGGGGGWSWYANPNPPQQQYQPQQLYAPPRVVQYGPAPAVQVAPPPIYYTRSQDPPRVHIQQVQPVAQPVVPLQPVIPHPAPLPLSPAGMDGLANLENAFYPLLVGAIALLVVFDYAA